MTRQSTQYLLARDASGAPSDILPFSDITLEGDEGHTVTIPSENEWYVAEFSVLPATGAISITNVVYNENPSLQLGGISYTTPELMFRRVVKGGSTVVLSRFRGSIDPIANYTIYLYKTDM